MDKIDRLSFMDRPFDISSFSSVEKAKQFSYFLRSVLDKHVHPSM